MSASPRAVRAARRVVVGEGIESAPVPVQKIARKYAHLMYETLPDDVSGMLLPLPSEAQERRWAIVVNEAHAPVRQRFTIAHELGHLLLHRYTTPHADGKFVVWFRNERSSKGSDREEVEANQFAAELLMPGRLVLAQATKLGLDLGDSDADAATGKLTRVLGRLALKFEVSVQAISFRLANLPEVAL